ncbi:hypothetical protein QFC20_004805 [Naganishia adeliensis]|uniref:Uncharacterized protein n=1 Tax=Naganishia adeliensis TaxID=92952 RepID=A0ACC2VV93_9TREE|nr:hypothetical protein QFC20_004805 [Naganishia adeliensis]
MTEEEPAHVPTESDLAAPTPATGSTDKRKLLPIPGWKGGRSSRALAKRLSFEDDDGLGFQASAQPSAVKRMREVPMSSSKTGGDHDDSPLQAKKSTRSAKHGAIPAHMATEMARSRTTGSPARGVTSRSPRKVSGKADVIHSDPVQEQSKMTPLEDRDRNLRRGPEASAGKNAAVKMSGRHGESGRMAGGRAEEKGLDSGSAVGGSTKAKQTKVEEYEINPERNHGLNYAYHEVERRKEERKKLAGHGCIECENYYNAVGEMPVVSRAPIWRSPSPESKRREARMASRKCPHGRHVERVDGAGHETKGRRRYNNGRGQAQSEEPDFETQGRYVAAINQEAERQKEAKRAEMRREAEKKDGKHRRAA